MKLSEFSGKNLEELPQTWNSWGQGAEKENFDNWEKKYHFALELEQELFKCSYETEIQFFLNFPINANYQKYVQTVCLHGRSQWPIGLVSRTSA